MAQGSKSRIIIWTIVGILVVIAVVMLVTKPKTSGRPPINPQQLSRNYERQFGRLEKRIADAQSANPGAPAESAKAAQVRRSTDKVGRNDPCPCGSGKKYKRCCGSNKPE